MVCTLFATGTAYIGARAFPTVFLDDKYSNELFRLNVRSPARRGCPNAFKHAVNLTIPAGAPLPADAEQPGRRDAPVTWSVDV